MKRWYWGLFYAFLLSGCFVSKQTIFMNPPLPQAALPQATIDSLLTQYHGFDAYYFSYYSSIEHCLDQTSWYAVYLHQCSYILLNSDSDANMFHMDVFDSTQVRSMYLRLTYPEGQVREFTLADCHVELTKAGTVYKLAFPNAVAGMKVEYGWEQKSYKPFASRFIGSSGGIGMLNPVRDYTIQYSYPLSWGYKLYSAVPETMKKISTHKSPDGTKMIITYHDTDVPGSYLESCSPSLEELGHIFCVQPDHLHVSRALKKAISYAHEPSWEYFSWEYSRAIYDPLSECEIKMFYLSQQVTQNCTTPLEKADSIFSYVQRNIKLSDDFAQDSYDKIINNKQGDLFRVLGLTCKLLECANIDGSVVFAHDFEDGPFDTNFTDFMAVRTPMILFHIDNEQYAVELYRKYWDISTIPPQFAGQPAVVIPCYRPRYYQDGKLYTSSHVDSKTLITLPNRPTLGRFDETYVINVDSLGILDTRQTVTVSSDQAAALRVMLDQDSSDTLLRDFAQTVIPFQHAEYTLIACNVQNRNQFDRPLQIVVEYKINNLVNLTSDEAIVKLDGLLHTSLLDSNTPLGNERHNPIAFLQNEVNERNLEIHFPSSWNLQTTLPAIERNGKITGCSGSAQVSGNTLTIHQVFQLHAGTYPQEDYPELQALNDSDGGFGTSWLVFERE